jgi:RND family efflux transporter MFP subunit
LDEQPRSDTTTTPESPSAEIALRAPAESPRRSVPIVIGSAVLGVVAAGAFLLVRADAKTNKIDLASRPKPVTVVEAKAGAYRASRTYVGTLEPWVEAKVGPELVSAFVDTVLVRPGAIVKRGDVLATLDCRNANAASQAVAMQARAIDARQKALAKEASRFQGLLDGGFVATNEAEQKEALSAAQAAELSAQKAKLAASSLEVSDCILRAPFDGEIATRTVDPGAFARPGTPIVSIVDRSTIRLTADAPEVDFSVVAPRTPVRVHLLATGADTRGAITRRAPSADPVTRTVRFEIDLEDPARGIPVGTTGEITIDVGEPVAATEIPLHTASVRGAKATVFLVEDGIAHARTFTVTGESEASLFVDTSLAAGARIVSEGRALLQEGDRVDAKVAAEASSSHQEPSR